MDNLNHTPGPWKIAYVAGKRNKNNRVTIGNLSGGEVCSMYLINSRSKADANLICIAPYMLEAIQYAITALSGTGGMVDAGELIMDVDNARKRLIQAIKPLSNEQNI